jgi:hypothetical protein
MMAGWASAVVCPREILNVAALFVLYARVSSRAAQTVRDLAQAR